MLGVLTVRQSLQILQQLSLPLQWPLAPLLSSLSPWTNNSMSDGFPLHHASLHYLLFSQHLWGWEGPGYVKKILKIPISPCLEVSTVNRIVLKAGECLSPSYLPLPWLPSASDTHCWKGVGLVHSEKSLYSDECHASQMGVKGLAPEISLFWCLHVNPCSTTDSSLSAAPCTVWVTQDPILKKKLPLGVSLV